MDNDPDGSWLSLDEAERRLGLSRDALRKRIARGKLEVRKGNDGTARVLVTSADLSGQESDTSGLVHDEGELGRALVRLEDALDAGERWRAAAEEGRLAAAKAEAARDASQALVADLRAERDRLAAELAESRKPWAVRLVEAFRRR